MFLQSLASRPAKGNFLHVPGFQDLADKMEHFVDLVVTRACPHTESPSLVAEEDTELGFKKIAEEKASPSGERELLGDEVESPEDCASMARDVGATHFSYGIHLR